MQTETEAWVRTFIAECAGLKIWVYRWEEFRRALSRERTAENSAPAPPTSASTTVGFSGESVHPVCPYSGAATSSTSAHPRHPKTILRILTFLIRRTLYGLPPRWFVFTATEIGVTTGAAAPTNSTTFKPLVYDTGTTALVIQTLPEPSTPTSPPAYSALLRYPVDGDTAAPLL